MGDAGANAILDAITVLPPLYGKDVDNPHCHTFTGPDPNWAPPGCEPCDGKTGTPDLRVEGRTLDPSEYEKVQRELAEQDLRRPYGAPWVTGVTVGDEPKPAQPHLVPVRKGGPWRGDGQMWEFWNAGECVCENRNGYRVHGGELQLLFTVWSRDTCAKDAPITGWELRAPKDWTGDMPKGTRLATDFVKGQRVRCKTNHKSAGVVTGVLPDRVNVRLDVTGAPIVGFTDYMVEGY